MAAQPITIPFSGAATSWLVYAIETRLLGWSLYNGAASNEGVQIYDGHTSASQLVALVALSPLESENTWLGPQGLAIRNALLVASTAGASLFGVVWVDEPERRHTLEVEAIGVVRG
jgi:hypothetical protein